MIPILFFYIPGWCSSHNFYVTLVSKKYFMSLDFHPLSLADRSLVWKYTENAGRRNCDLSFANLYAWRMLYRTEVAEWGGFLVFRFYADGHLAYLMPVGEGDWCAILQALKEDACRLSHPLLLLGVCEDLMPQVEECMGEDCRVNANRDHADYIYLRESLAALSGKKLQAKRNHVNRFKALYPDYRYEELTDENYMPGFDSPLGGVASGRSGEKGGGCGVGSHSTCIGASGRTGSEGRCIAGWGTDRGIYLRGSDLS